MFFFTSDQHFFHQKIIEYCNRPFSSVEEMNEGMINKHNEVVKKNDRVIHLGDFTLISDFCKVKDEIVSRLNGNHTFLKGSHDKWLSKVATQIWEKKISNNYIVCCHYAMRVWPRSHYNSWQLYGHSHSTLPPQGKQWDVGVDNNNFYPVSFDQIVEIMKTQPDNFNLRKKQF